MHSLPRLLRTTLLTLTMAASAACGSTTENSVPSVPASETYAASLGVNLSAMMKRNDALYVQDVRVGPGDEAIVGRQITVQYTGYFVDGRSFDSSVGRGPYTFTLGAGNVIRGWDVGLPGMKVGGKRKLVIGSEYAYGRTGQGSIGPNQTLVFDVELISVQ